MKPRVSLTMIVRNEEHNLAACLESAAGLFDEIVVVDTGSRDRTKEIAAGFKAHVFDFPWRDDFAAARNEALDHATGDWVFWLDADDRLDATNREKVRTLLASLKDENAAYMMRSVSQPNAATGTTVVLDLARLFPRRPEIRWEYRIHEQILASVQRCGGQMRWTDIVVAHCGYRDPVVQARKMERNLRLCELDAADRPDDAFALQNLGKTYLGVGRAAEAVPVLRRSLERVAPDNSLVPGLHHLLSKALSTVGRKDEALAVCRAGRARFSWDAELLFQEAMLLCERGDYVPAETCLRQLLQMKPRQQLYGTEEPGVRGHLARHNLALLHLKQGRAAEAEAEWLKVVDERPDFAQGWFGLGDLWWSQGRFDEFDRAASRLEKVPHRATEAALLRARGHLARQEFAAARALLEEVAVRQPHSVGTRVLLSRALLQEGRDWEAAEKVLREILALDPTNVPAREHLALVQRRAASPTPHPNPPPQGGREQDSANPSLQGGREKMRVSLTMIVRDEEHNLPACLDSAAGLFDEIVVVDTGSKDRTKEVAARFGAKLFDFAWCDDFAAARSEALRHATGDWVFWLDADDRLDEVNREKLRSLFAALKDEKAAYMMKCLSRGSPSSPTAVVVDHARLFRNLPGLRWQYRVHEQILPAVQRHGGEMRWTDIVVHHTGYQDPALLVRKNERCLRLLELDLADHPDDSFILFNLGWTYQRMARPAEAIRFLQRSLEKSRPADAFLRVLYTILARALHQGGQKQQAATVCRAGRERFPDDGELLFQHALILQDLGDLKGAEETLLQVLHGSQVKPYLGIADQGRRGYKARHQLGLVYGAQGRPGEAETQFRAVVAEQPQFSAAWAALADVLTAGQRWADLDALARQAQTSSPTDVEAAVVRARGLMARQEFTAARQLLVDARARTPDALWLHIALSHVLMCEGRDLQAAEKALHDLLALDPGNPQALDNLALVQRRRREGYAALPGAVLQVTTNSPAPGGAVHGVPSSPTPHPTPPPQAGREKMRVSLTTIVRNEEANLAACLESVAGLVDEIIVVDTGSTDRTKEVAARLGARVFDFPWCDNFAAARNEAIRHATGDWIFWLDADDRLDEANRGKLRRLFASLKDENVAYLVGCTSDPAGGIRVDHVRLFRRREDVRWKYRVHEQILPSILRAGGTMCRTDLLIRHTGYLDMALVQRKQERNLRLLHLQDAEEPNNSTVLFHLGYTYHALNRPAEALPVLERCLQVVARGDTIVRKIYSLLAQCHTRLGRRDQALVVCRQGREVFPNDTELLHLESHMRFHQGDLAGAEACLLALLATPPEDYIGVDLDTRRRGSEARYDLAVICRDQGRFAEAEAQWLAAVTADPACTKGWMGLADLYLSLGREADVERAVQRLRNELKRPVEAAVVESRLRMARREFAAGRAVLEEALPQDLHGVWPRLALAHVILREGREPDAAVMPLREVLAREPNNPQAKALLAQVAARPIANGTPPTGRPRVSLTMIVRNEEANLPRCLGSAAGLFDEIVVVDTGSTDRTKEVAAGFGAKVFDFPWCDDFAAARNESLRHATGDWIFWLDADDWLDDKNRTQLRALLTSLPDENVGYYCKCLCQVGARKDSVVADLLRLFRNRADIRWRYRIHEKIEPALRAAGGVVRVADVAIHHSGYQDPTVERRKLERNLRMLQMQKDEYPGDPVPLFHLGQTSLGLGHTEEGLAALEECLRLCGPQDGLLRRLHGQLVRAYHQLGRREEALAVCERGRALFPDDAEMLFKESMLRDELGDAAGAEACLRHLLQPEVQFVFIDAELRGYKARHNLALLCRRGGRDAAAEELWRAVLAERPHFVPAVLALAELYASRGRRRDLEALLPRLEADPQTAAAAARLRTQAAALPPEPSRARVSLTTIVRDEEAGLARCLASVADLVDEIVIVDTGSTDRTKEVAAAFGAKVVDFPWCDDFAAARNEALRHATGDWALWLDGDEWLEEVDRGRLRQLFAGLQGDNAAYVMKQLCLRQAALPGASGGERVVEQVRLFRNLPAVRWEHRVFEQVLPSVRAAGGELRHTDVVVQHTGYEDAALYRAKVERNLRLARLEERERPEDSYTLYLVGLFEQQLGRPVESVEALRRATKRLAAGSTYGAKAFAMLVQGYQQLGRAGEALATCRTGRSQFAHDPELLYQEGTLLQQAGKLEAAETCFRELLGQPAGQLEVNLLVAARHALALLCRKKGRTAEAETQWLAAVEERPEFALAWLELGELYIGLGKGELLEKVLRRLERDLGRAEDAAVLRARGHLARKEFAVARTLLERTIARWPRSLRPRQAYSHVLLLEGRDPAAAEKALREVLALNPGDAEARRNLGVLLGRRGLVAGS